MNKAPTFEEFWEAYGVKRNKLRAAAMWNRLSAREKRAAIEGITAYRAALPPGIAMAYPQNYLRDHRWEDEAEPAAPVQGDMFFDERSGKAERKVQGEPEDSNPAAKPETTTIPLDDMETW